MSKGKSIKLNVLLNIVRQMSKVLFPLITFPYISRVLQVENYGKISFGNSIISYFSLIAALGITNYAIREGAGLREERKKLESFAGEIFTINLLATIISYILLGILLLTWNKLAEYKMLIIVLSMGILFTTIGIDWLYVIYEDYLYITIRSLAVQVISLVLMFLIVKQKDDYIIYAIITVLAAVGGNIFNFFHSRKYMTLSITFHPHLKQHIVPILVLFCNAIMISVYVNSDITLLGIMKDDTSVGIYGVAVKIYILVKSLLNAILIVTLPRLSYYIKLDKMDEYNKLIKKVLKLLLVVVLPSLVGLLMISKNVILIISGEEYISGQYPLKILCFALSFSMVAAFFTTFILLPNKREKKVLIATIISSLVNLGFNFIFIPLFSYNGAAITTVIAEGTVMVIAMYFARDIFDFKGYKNTIITVIYGCIAIVVICSIVNLMKFNTLVDTALKISLSAIIYGIVLYIGKNEMVSEQFDKIMVRMSFKK